MAFGIGTSERVRGGRRRRVGAIVATLALSLVVPTGLTPVAQADDKGLGRPDVPEQRVNKVRQVDGPGAKKARAKVAKEKKADAERARQARAEQRSAWPRQGDAVLDLDTGESAQAKSRYEVMQTAMSQRGDVSSVLSETENTTMVALRASLSEAQRRLAELQQVLGPRHPRVGAAQAELDRAQRAIRSESERLVANLRRAYAELDGEPEGEGVDPFAGFMDMATLNGGEMMTCHA